MTSAAHVIPKVGTSREWLHQNIGYDGPGCLTWPFGAHPTGYGAFGDKATGEHESHYAHRYMCELINGPAPSSDHEAAHSCGRGKFGCVDPRHLSWKTAGGNALDSRLHGTQVRNTWGPGGKLTRRQIAAIWALKGRETQAVIAPKFDVSPSTIRDIYLGRSHRGMTTISMLRLFSERDFGNLPNFCSGLWSRQNLEAIIDDLVVETNADQAEAAGQQPKD